MPGLAFWQVWLLALHSISLAAVFSPQTLQDTLNLLGYPAVTLFILIESTGVPFPGESMLLLASFYSAIDNQLRLPIIIACAAFGAIVGDNFGYYIGRSSGRAFIERFGKYFFLKPQHLEYAEKFFLKHGNKTVFFGRFVAILRIWAAFLAGVNHMRWRTFLFYNAAGGIIWAVLVGTLGYFAGRIFQNNYAEVERLASTVGWITGTIAATAIAIALIIFCLRYKIRKKDSDVTEDTEEEQVKEKIVL